MKKIIGIVCLVLAAAFLFGACAKADDVRYNYNLAEYIDIPDPRDELTALAAILVVDCCMEVQRNANN